MNEPKLGAAASSKHHTYLLHVCELVSLTGSTTNQLLTKVTWDVPEIRRPCKILEIAILNTVCGWLWLPTFCRVMCVLDPQELHFNVSTSWNIAAFGGLIKKFEPIVCSYLMSWGRNSNNCLQLAAKAMVTPCGDVAIIMEHGR